MRIKLTTFLVISFLINSAQTGRIIGVVFDEDKVSVPFTTVHIQEINKVIYSNSEGFFSTPKLNYGTYHLTLKSIGYQPKTFNIILDSQVKKIDNIRLVNKTYELNEYEFSEEEDFNIRKLRAIEGIMITQGKKTEAIKLEKLDANKATNQSRQIYAKIPGLNIWESDGAGIQIGLGGRGLNPSRNSNFNTRQNGYDISADALGYPESYYSPPSEAIDEIHMIRGAASLQFGPQFGGLINFKLKEANPNKKIELFLRNSIGSFGLNNTFISLGSTYKKHQFYGYFNYKVGDDWRPNSSFEVKNLFVNYNIKTSDYSKLRFEFTKMQYLAQQPGGLTDNQFYLNTDTSLRSRNWFNVDWNLGAIHYDYEFNSTTKINSRTFGLVASRKAIGNMDKPFYQDFMQNRNIISGEFKNIGNETRFLHLYDVNKNPSALLLGARVYRGFNRSIQGEGSDSNEPDFNFLGDVNDIVNSTGIISNYQFPSFNFSFFGENIFNINNKLSITPGFRYELISTISEGQFKLQELDNAGNVIFDTVEIRNNNKTRDFFIFGIGVNFKLSKGLELYSNFSQNFRSINFSDMQIVNPNFQINPSIDDEKGYNIDLGLRTTKSKVFLLDFSLFHLFYNNRIGTVWVTQSNVSNFPGINSTAPYFQIRTNVSKSRTYGAELITEINWIKLFTNKEATKRLTTFLNLSTIDARYVSSDEPAYDNKKVELVPPVTLRTGLSIGNNKFSASYQFSYVNEHYSDATNAVTHPHGIVGLIPSYYVMDISLTYSMNKFQFEGGINNLTNRSYFTRRATGYPGPGIIPSPPRNFYIAAQIKL